MAAAWRTSAVDEEDGAAPELFATRPNRRGSRSLWPSSRVAAGMWVVGDGKNILY
jgi:hypothetical protein